MIGHWAPCGRARALPVDASIYMPSCTLERMSTAVSSCVGVCEKCIALQVVLVNFLMNKPK